MADAPMIVVTAVQGPCVCARKGWIWTPMGKPVLMLMSAATAPPAVSKFVPTMSAATSAAAIQGIGSTAMAAAVMMWMNVYRTMGDAAKCVRTFLGHPPAAVILVIDWTPMPKDVPPCRVQEVASAPWKTLFLK